MKERAISATSCAIENYKNSKEFKNEVGEAILDSYLKGFTECKAKVLAAYSSLDLKDIIVDATKQEKEEEEEAEVPAMKMMMIKVKGVKTTIDATRRPTRSRACYMSRLASKKSPWMVSMKQIASGWL